FDLVVRRVVLDALRTLVDEESDVAAGAIGGGDGLVVPVDADQPRIGDQGALRGPDQHPCESGGHRVVGGGRAPTRGPPPAAGPRPRGSARPPPPRSSLRCGPGAAPRRPSP